MRSISIHPNIYLIKFGYINYAPSRMLNVYLFRYHLVVRY